MTHEAILLARRSRLHLLPWNSDVFLRMKVLCRRGARSEHFMIFIHAREQREQIWVAECRWVAGNCTDFTYLAAAGARTRQGRGHEGVSAERPSNLTFTAAERHKRVPRDLLSAMARGTRFVDAAASTSDEWRDLLEASKYWVREALLKPQWNAAASNADLTEISEIRLWLTYYYDLLWTLINTVFAMSCAMYGLHMCLTLLNIAGVANVRGRLDEPVQPQSGAAAVSSSIECHAAFSLLWRAWTLELRNSHIRVPAQVGPNILKRS